MVVGTIAPSASASKPRISSGWVLGHVFATALAIALFVGFCLILAATLRSEFRDLLHISAFLLAYAFIAALPVMTMVAWHGYFRVIERLRPLALNAEEFAGFEKASNTRVFWTTVTMAALIAAYAYFGILIIARAINARYFELAGSPYEQVFVWAMLIVGIIGGIGASSAVCTGVLYQRIAQLRLEFRPFHEDANAGFGFLLAFANLCNLMMLSALFVIPATAIFIQERAVTGFSYATVISWPFIYSVFLFIGYYWLYQSISGLIATLRLRHMDDAWRKLESRIGTDQVDSNAVSLLRLIGEWQYKVFDAASVLRIVLSAASPIAIFLLQRALS